MVRQLEYPITPAGYMRCQLCAVLQHVGDVEVCESCGQLFCPSCAAPYHNVSAYSYCFVCVPDVPEEEDWTRFLEVGEDDSDEMPEL